MNEILKNGGKLFIKTIFINIMSFFVVISLLAFGIGAFAQDVGYVAYGTKSEGEEPVKLYTHYFEDGKDEKLAEYEKQGYTVDTESGIMREMGKTADVMVHIITQVFALGIFLSFIYPTLWDIGFKDSNLVHTGHKVEDKQKGLKIGAVACIPAALLYLFLIIGNIFTKDVPIALYRLLNSAFYPLITVIMGSAKNIGDLSIVKIVLLVIPVIAIPLAAFVSYRLGYKGFALSEKLTYKKTKKQEK